jgi:hypothetical protein
VPIDPAAPAPLVFPALPVAPPAPAPPFVAAAPEVPTPLAPAPVVVPLPDAPALALLWGLLFEPPQAIAARARPSGREIRQER